MKEYNSTIISEYKNIKVSVEEKWMDIIKPFKCEDKSLDDSLTKELTEKDTNNNNKENIEKPVSINIINILKNENKILICCEDGSIRCVDYKDKPSSATNQFTFNDDGLYYDINQKLGIEYKTCIFKYNPEQSLIYVITISFFFVLYFVLMIFLIM